MRRFLIAAFSTGWLLPIWFSVECLFTYIDTELWPALRGQPPVNSFPFLHYSFLVFTVGCIWLAAVVFFWAWKLAGKRTEKTHETN
jgi:hypothetical protein